MEAVAVELRAHFEWKAFVAEQVQIYADTAPSSAAYEEAQSVLECFVEDERKVDDMELQYDWSEGARERWGGYEDMEEAYGRIWGKEWDGHIRDMPYIDEILDAYCKAFYEAYKKAVESHCKWLVEDGLPKFNDAIRQASYDVDWQDALERYMEDREHPCWANMGDDGRRDWGGEPCTGWAGDWMAGYEEYEDCVGIEILEQVYGAGFMLLPWQENIGFAMKPFEDVFNDLFERGFQRLVEAEARGLKWHDEFGRVCDEVEAEVAAEREEEGMKKWETRPRCRMAAFRIHRFWRDVCYDPTYAHARARVLRQLDT
jgi:hypothetical protein